MFAAAPSWNAVWGSIQDTHGGDSAGGSVLICLFQTPKKSIFWWNF
jgi:hypothetical protein